MSSPNRYRALLFFLAAAIGFSLWQWMDGRAQNNANCSAPYYINEQMPNGARWSLCWEHRNRDGIILRDVYYTAPNGTRRRVLAEAGIAQVHVPYDDNSARYHDITDDGFGGRNLASLTSEECPGGTLLPYEEKNVLCQEVAPAGYARRDVDTPQQNFALTIFSVSTSGEYNYIPMWRFMDDGSIEPIMGATGKLQRFDTGSAHSWPIRNNGISGLSHIHNYYWRLDFDIGENGQDDVIEEMDLLPAPSGNGRTLTTTQLDTEASRSVAPELMRTWRIQDTASPSESGSSIAYQLDPISLNHRDVGPEFEPWTHSDLFITKQNDCERYVSHNPRVEGCGSQVTDFVNGESLSGADLVLWYGITFHHVPRDEDEPFMHTHWDGFHIRALGVGNLGAAIPTPVSTEVPPTPTQTPTPAPAIPPLAKFTASPITGSIPLTVTLDASPSVDGDGQIVGYAWTFVDGFAATGITLSRTLTVAGQYPITLTVTDAGGLTDQLSQTIIAIEKGTINCALGDVDCDGELTIGDAISILKQIQEGEFVYYIPGLPPSTTTLFGPLCDVGMDGDCDQDDAVMIFECSTGVTNLFCTTTNPGTASVEEVAQFEALLREINKLYLPILQ